MMIRSSFMAMFLLCAVCSFCGKDFITLGRHSCHSKQRVHQAEQSSSHDQTARDLPAANSLTVVISTVVKCCCGKICKGTRRLKMHQRSCCVINGLNNELCTDLEEQVAENNTQEDLDLTGDELAASLSSAENETTPEIKKGIKLPKHDSEWSTANEYFKSTLPLNGPIKSQELDASIQVLDNTIYDYFARTYGHIGTIPDKNLNNKYKDHTLKDLKKALKCLKLSTNSDITEIKYVSRVLRDKLRNSNNTQTDTQQDQSFNHDKYISSVTSGVMLRTFLQVSGLYYHPSTCKIASIILEKH